MLQSVDLNQVKKQGIDARMYISTKENLDPDEDCDLTDTGIWTEMGSGTSLNDAKAVAVDLRKTTEGEDFVLAAGKSVVVHLYMKAPKTAPEAKSGEGYPYAYNNIYISDTVLPADGGDGQHFLIHQDYTKLSLVVAGDLDIHKTDSETGLGISGISFSLKGTSAYGTDVDETYTTDKDGNLKMEHIPMGTYTFRETDAGKDYLLDASPRTVTVNGDGSVTFDGKTAEAPEEIENSPRVHTDIVLTKVDAVYPTKTLPGAVYRLSGTSDYGNDILVTAASDENGLLTFENIEKGTYSLKEVTAPEGYILDKEEYTVKVRDDGGITYPGET